MAGARVLKPLVMNDESSTKCLPPAVSPIADYELLRCIGRLAAELPLSALVMETDSPDIAPHWLYTTAAQRAAGQAPGRNEPGELPRIAQHVADLRSMSLESLALATTANALAALPRLRCLVPC